MPDAETTLRPPESGLSVRRRYPWTPYVETEQDGLGACRETAAKDDQQAVPHEQLPYKRRRWALWAGLGALVLVAGYAAVSESGPRFLLRPSGRETVALTARSSAPTSTTVAVPDVPAYISCDMGPDLIVRSVVPGSPPSAAAMGSTSAVDNCEPTITLLEQTWPSQAGYCMTVALASENPGYELTYMSSAVAPPAPPLNDVIATIGDGPC